MNLYFKVMLLSPLFRWDIHCDIHCMSLRLSQALSVEKTSKRGGRIVHEKDLLPPPPLFGEASTTPPQIVPQDDEFLAPPAPLGEASEDSGEKPSITDLMRNPSKVVLCKVK